MLRKVELREDKNFFDPNAKANQRPLASFLLDDLPKNTDEAIHEARKIAWPYWINAEPLIYAISDEVGTTSLYFISDTLRNKVILLSIWDYTLLPCRRNLSYIQEWNKRYSNAGLVIIGVHAPVFEFAKDKQLLIDAVREYGITFPVVLDNDFAIWKSLENNAWPRNILIDSKGRFQMDVVGEGQYTDIEKAIQLNLREISPGLACPPILKPLREIDREDYQIPHTSDDIFFGLKKNPEMGNVQKPETVGSEIHFVDDSGGAYESGTPYFNGIWYASNDSMYGTSTKEDVKMTIAFEGTDLYIVARAKAKSSVELPDSTKLTVSINGKPIPDDSLGGDCTINEFRRSMITLRDAKLYHVATRLEHKNHVAIFTVEANSADTVEFYAIFFEHRG